MASFAKVTFELYGPASYGPASRSPGDINWWTEEVRSSSSPYDDNSYGTAPRVCCLCKRRPFLSRGNKFPTHKDCFSRWEMADKAKDKVPEAPVELAPAEDGATETHEAAETRR